MSDDWRSWSVHVKKLVEKHDKDIDRINIDIAIIKLKMESLLGIAAFIGSVVGSAITLIVKHFIFG